MLLSHSDLHLELLCPIAVLSQSPGRCTHEAGTSQTVDHLCSLTKQSDGKALRAPISRQYTTFLTQHCTCALTRFFPKTILCFQTFLTFILFLRHYRGFITKKKTKIVSLMLKHILSNSKPLPRRDFSKKSRNIRHHSLFQGQNAWHGSQDGKNPNPSRKQHMVTVSHDVAPDLDKT